MQTGGPGTYESLDDGRKVCLNCLDSIVVDTKDCQPLYREILKFYKSIGMPIEQEIPMLLVARSALNAARDGEKDVSGFAYSTTMFEFSHNVWIHSIVHFLYLDF